MRDHSRSDRRLVSAERQAKVVQLRRLRLSFEEIGNQLGINKGMAWKLYQQALRDLPAPHIAEHRAEELTLVDDATRRLLAICADASVTPRTRVEAWNAIRGWAEHKARILGLNAALKVEVAEEIRVQILALAAELGTVEPGGTAGIAGDAETRGIAAPPA